MVGSHSGATAQHSFQASHNTLHVFSREIIHAWQSRHRQSPTGDFRDHRHPAFVPCFCAVGFQEHINNLCSQAGTNESGAQGKHVGIVMFASIAGTGQVIGHGRANSRHFIGHH